MLKRRLLIFSLASTMVIGLALSAMPISIFAATNTVSLSETSEAFKNPMKGFRPSRYIQDTSFKDYEYTTTYKQYIKYTDLENFATDSVQKIKDWSNASWAGIENKNLKVIPRVVIVYPGTGEYWADGIPHTDPINEWLSDTLKTRMVALVAKLGQAWDNDPRVAAIELGLYGNWGENHIYPLKFADGTDRIPADFQQALGTAYNNAFKNKKVMVRYPTTFTNFNFGYLWDSFALPDDSICGNGEISRDSWRTQMNTGEVAYDWGDQSNLGGSPNGTLGSTSNTNYVDNWINSTHTSSLGWIAEYDATNPSVEVGATTMQKAMGYRFVVNQAAFTTNTNAGGTMDVSFNVTNKGSAPFYYQWPVEASLLNSDKSVAWTGTFNTDIRNWLPGTSYDVSTTFTIPSGLASGTYTLALAVLDPAGNKPSLRFANTNYYKGGRTPVGKVGIGQSPSDQNLGSFDGLKSDNTLSYSLTSSSDTQPPTAPTNLISTGKTDTTVNISWTASTDNVGVTGYDIYNGGALAGTTAGTSSTVAGLVANTAYTFTVKAKDAAGNQSSASNSVNVTTNPSTGGTGLLLDNFDGTPVWPGGNDLGNWAGANGFTNGSGGAGVISSGALTLQFNNNGWFGSDVTGDISSYTKMVIIIKGAAGGEENLFHLSLGGVDKTFAGFSQSTITTNYKTITIDLVSNGVNRISPGQLNMIFWYGGNSSVTIDEIKFTN